MSEVLSTVKTYVLGTDNTTYFEVITITYDDESQDVTKRRVGPATELANDQADKIERDMLTLAQSSYYVARAKSIINDAGTTDATINTLTGVSPFKKIQDRYQVALLTAGWTIDEGAGFVPLVFTVNAQGALRFSINGAATKPAKIYGAVIRLNNYPASPIDTDFHLAENGNKYHSLPNKAVVIKKP